ncbi:MAG: hypothetical protein IPK02_13885 [Candidatus Accumulibacter sp.]|uniref:PEP-CTERM protein-sorting domain-containing protein n=1 Tax=Candidatus Accumulibacter affinis TaxID=2954384 RepID=A0A935TIT2_9PROT|nr:hypothetical protein [Candidatus Accumulibacter affinis]
MVHKLSSWLGRTAVLVLCLSSIAELQAADWMINEDYYQTDSRGASDFEFLLAGDVAARITGGGETSITNAFSDPTRSTSLQPGFNNTIVRFAGSNAIPVSPTTKRHFGIFGTGQKPAVITKAWSFPNAPFRVPVPKSNFDFSYDPLNEALRITLENISPYSVTFANVGYTLSSSEYPIDQLTANGLPPSAFQSLFGFDREYLPGDFVSAIISNVPAHAFAVTHATASFSGNSIGMDYQSTGDEWAQVRVAAAVAEPGSLLLALLALIGLGFAHSVRANRLPMGKSTGVTASLLCLALAMLPAGRAAADVFVVPLAAPPTAGDTRPFIDLKAKDTTGKDITIKTLIDGGSASSELKVTAAVGGQLGVSGGTAGTERGINGTSPSTAGASIPPAAGVGFSSPPVTPAGQAAASPPLPTKATVGTLPPGRQATLGSGYLEANFDFNGRLDGYYLFVAKGQGATGVATANAIASYLAFATAVATNPDGRPKDTKSEEVTPFRHSVPPDEEAIDGGFVLGVDVRSASATQANVPFILKSGFSNTIISAQWASLLGLNLGSLPTGQVETNFGTMAVGFAQLELDLFSDPSFPSFLIPVSIALNPADNPFGDNVLGSDVLGQIPYWDIDQTNPLAPVFSAAARLSPIPEPSTAALLGVTMVCLLIGVRKARINVKVADATFTLTAKGVPPPAAVMAAPS